MKLIPIFKATVKNGVLDYKDVDSFLDYLKTLDGDIEVLVRKPKETRTIRQNKYYFAILKLISEHTGEEVEDLHNHFAYKWLSNKGKTGKLMSRKSTASLTKEEFKEYINRIKEWGTRFLRINFPEPEDILLERELFEVNLK